MAQAEALLAAASPPGGRIRKARPATRGRGEVRPPSGRAPCSKVWGILTADCGQGKQVGTNCRRAGTNRTTGRIRRRGAQRSHSMPRPCAVVVHDRYYTRKRPCGDATALCRGGSRPVLRRVSREPVVILHGTRPWHPRKVRTEHDCRVQGKWRLPEQALRTDCRTVPAFSADSPGSGSAAGRRAG
jgi:hypothetical protein